MATRGTQKKAKTGSASQMKKLQETNKKVKSLVERTKTDLESARRKSNVAKNKAAGNAGLSSKRLNRMEAEAERKTAQQRKARRDAKRDPIYDNLRTEDRRKPASTAQKVAKTASRFGAGSRVINPVGIALTPNTIGVGKGESRSMAEERAVANAQGTGAALQKKIDANKGKTKNYNVGVSKGGVSFNEAFRHFRSKGAKSFTWNGKKYTTEIKK